MFRIRRFLRLIYGVLAKLRTYTPAVDLERRRCSPYVSSFPDAAALVQAKRINRLEAIVRDLILFDDYYTVSAACYV